MPRMAKPVGRTPGSPGAMADQAATTARPYGPASDLRTTTRSTEAPQTAPERMLEPIDRLGIALGNHFDVTVGQVAHRSVDAFTPRAASSAKNLKPTPCTRPPMRNRFATSTHRLRARPPIVSQRRRPCNAAWGFRGSRLGAWHAPGAGLADNPARSRRTNLPETEAGGGRGDPLLCSDW